ncbi:AAA family ATPase [Pseudomonas sp. S2_H01]
MAFVIEAVAHDHGWIPLTHEDIHDDGQNVFSLVVGQNATGKSRLLRKIVSHFIFDNQFSERDRYLRQNPMAPMSHYSHLSGNEELVVGRWSAPSPSKIIAVSTGRHDRFPTPNSKELIDPTGRYHYIAPSEKGNVSALTRSLIAITSGLETHPWKFMSLASIFRYLGFEPILDFKLSLDPALRVQWTRDHAKAGGHTMLTLPGWEEAPKKYQYDKSLVDYHYQLLDHIYRQKHVSYEIDLGLSEPSRNYFSLEKVADALRSGLIRVSDLTLNVRENHSRLKLSQASSGQQCMLVMILGIAGSIEDNSLICIDEPEISLHPKWQTDIISQLQYAFHGYRGCHFIIATHSPQIVAGLTADKGFVLSLEDRQLYSSKDYSNRSADYQLAQVFNAPGVNNEYLIRITLMLLTKISRREVLNREDWKQLEMLDQLKESLASNDPVRHLIDQVQMLR